MRFVAAIVSFVIAFAAIALGIAQRTIFATPDHVAAISGSVATDNTAIVISGELLNTHEGRQKVTVSGDGPLFAAYGRTADVLAWIGNTQYTTVEYDPETGILAPNNNYGAEMALPDPHGSDLWLDEYSRNGNLSFVVDLPESVSLVIMSDGSAPAPMDVGVTWPVDNRTPWSGPLILGGVILLMVGLVTYLWALSQVRRARGPRRKTPRPPKQPKRKTLKSGTPKKALGAAPTRPAIEKKKKGRRSANVSRAFVPAGLMVVTLALTGCSSESWPSFLGGTGDIMPSPSASESDAPPEDVIPPVVESSQLQEIMAKISVTLSRADEDRDPELAATRLTGAALQLREANYNIRKRDKNYAKPESFPSGELKIVLPQQTEEWPRAVLAVIVPEPVKPSPSPTPSPSPSSKSSKNSSKETAAAVAPTMKQPAAVMLIQETPRDNYKVAYHMLLSASVTLPSLPAATTGTQRVAETVTLLEVSPNELVTQYGDVLLNGEESEFFANFDVVNDQLIPLIGKEAQAKRKKTLPSIARMDFTIEPGEWEPIGFATVDAGAIVAVQLNEVETVRPVEPGAIINPEGAVKSLSGLSSTNRGTVATYGDQLLFYVPASTSDQKVVLLGWSSHLIAAKERR